MLGGVLRLAVVRTPPSWTPAPWCGQGPAAYVPTPSVLCMPSATLLAVLRMRMHDLVAQVVCVAVPTLHMHMTIGRVAWSLGSQCALTHCSPPLQVS